MYLFGLWKSNQIKISDCSRLKYCSIFGDTQGDFGDTQLCGDTQFEKQWSKVCIFFNSKMLTFFFFTILLDGIFYT